MYVPELATVELPSARPCAAAKAGRWYEYRSSLAKPSAVGGPSSTLPENDGTGGAPSPKGPALPLRGRLILSKEAADAPRAKGRKGDAVARASTELPAASASDS